MQKMKSISTLRFYEPKPVALFVAECVKPMLQDAEKNSGKYRTCPLD
jgi:hypothetical protein